MGLDIYLVKPDGEEIDTEVQLTHNLRDMAVEADVYKALWRPYLLTKHPDFKDHIEEYQYEEQTVVTALDVLPYLTQGLLTLLSDAERFRKLNPPNGWGSYENLVNELCKYIAICNQYPNFRVRPCR